MILAFDTETTGKADFKKSFDDPCQPKLVQLGAILFDSSFTVRAELNAIVRPIGFEIPVEASNVHGITTQIATVCGLPLSEVVRVFMRMMEKSEVLVAHNADFDRLIMNGCLCDQDIHIKVGETFCTMKAMTDICKLPNKNGYSSYKWPTLQEAHKHAFDCEFDGAHDAMADVRACARIYKWIKDGQPSLENTPFV